MKALLPALLATALAACSGTPVRRGEAAPLFADARFAPQAEAIDARRAFDLSAPMREYLRTRIAMRADDLGARRALYESLRDDLRLEYDAAATRTAAEAFEARAGNCLSLVILTGAMARALNVPVHYQRVYGHDTWSRSGTLAFRSGHVNLVLGPRMGQNWNGPGAESEVTIDFVPTTDYVRQDTRLLTETELLAMYLNNRAVEIMADGDLDRAYWWARAALELAPAYPAAANTLGVLYMRHGDIEPAERALRHALAREPENPQALGNLAQVLAAAGREAEAQAVRAQLAQVAPEPPFHFFDLGRTALASGDAAGARRWFERELLRMPYDDQLHFALAQAYLRLGQPGQARVHLARAAEYSTGAQRQVYSAKLSSLRTGGSQPLVR